MEDEEQRHGERQAEDGRDSMVTTWGHGAP